MTKIEKLQKEYPMFELTIRPASYIEKQSLVKAGCKEPERMLYFRCNGSGGLYYEDNVGDYDWSISTLRNNLDRWVLKI